MAFTRKFLSALGIEADKIDQIIDAHSEVIEGVKAERDGYKADSDKLAEIQKQLDEANKRLEASEKDDYKGKYEAEKEAHEKLRSEYAAKETAAKKDGAFKDWLKENGFSEKGSAKIVKYGGFKDKIELDENGKLSNGDKLMPDIENEWGEYKGKIENNDFMPTNPPIGEKGQSNNQSSEAAKIAAAYHAKMYGETPNQNKEG